MPPRTITLSVLAFWLAMTAWLLWRDVWPSIAPGEPPPFAIARMDDSRSQWVVNWKVEHHPPGDQTQSSVEYNITTMVAHEPGSDVFTLHARMRPDRLSSDPKKFLRSVTLISTYRIERIPGRPLEGRMLGLDVQAEYPAGAPNPTGNRTGRFRGQVNGGACDLHWETEGGVRRQQGSESLAVSHHALVLLPLHPLDRIRGLRSGQRWGCYLLDPLESSALASSTPKSVWINARVSTQTETFPFVGQDKECRIIEYDGGDVHGKTWVEVKEDRVLRMEVQLGQQRWVILRIN